jgi:glutathione S-transferase
MITLYQFPPVWGLPNASPFCMRVENFLRMTALPYDVKYVRDPRKAPKGKLPFIKIDGQIIADSEIIIDNLKLKTNDLLDKGLNAEQKALGVLIENTLCEHLYWFLVYMRWQDDAGWLQIKSTYFNHLTGLEKFLIPSLVRKSTVKQLYSQGLGRHAREEVLTMGYKTIDALAEILGTKKYFLGSEPSSVDATAFAFLANILYYPYDDPFKTHVKQRANLKVYCELMGKLFYPELAMN